MSRARSPSAALKSAVGSNVEIQRLEGGDLALTVESNEEQSLVLVATDSGRAVFAIDDPGVTFADAIEASRDRNIVIAGSRG